MRPTINETGNSYGKLTVLDRADRVSGINGAQWLCECKCGRKVVKSGHHLRQGFATTCGECGLTHGCSKTGARSRAYSCHKNMKNRCLNRNVPSYQDYGARGVTVCERWMTFENFLVDMGEPEPGMTLDRIDYAGNYEPGNCRWLSRAGQNRNKRNNVNLTIDGKTMTMLEWSREGKLGYLTLRQRLKLGWDAKRAVFTPVRGKTMNGLAKS